MVYFLIFFRSHYVPTIVAELHQCYNNNNNNGSISQCHKIGSNIKCLKGVSKSVALWQ